MPASEDRPISEFPIALQLLNTALVLASNPDGLGGYDSVHATLAEIGRVILETQYTQDLGNVDVFNAIKNCRVLSGTATPASNVGQDGQIYIKYQTASNTDTVVGMYFKKDNTWLEIATGGGGGDVGIECTQAQYDAWEQAGDLLTDTNYYITDGQSGGGVVIDDTTASATTVWSSYKTADEISRIDTALSGTDITSNVTLNSDISLVQGQIYRLGSLITINAVLKANQSIPNNASIWTGLPKAKGNYRFSKGTSDGVYYATEWTAGGLFIDNNATHIGNFTAVNANKYIFVNCSYITSD